MSIRRDAAIEHRVIDHMRELGMPSPEENLVVIAFWEDDNLGLQVKWKRLVMNYAVRGMTVTTRHPVAGARALVDEDPRVVDRIAYTTAVESCAMARHEWQRARRFWPESYPVVETKMKRGSGGAARAPISRLVVPAAPARG